MRSVYDAMRCHALSETVRALTPAVSCRYVKAYMSVGGKDIKSSKQKTKCKKKTTGPVFEESLSLKHDSAGGTTDHRVQITLWDHGGSHTHKSHCHGWLSFGVRDLMQATSPTAGWFKLQSESEGRTQYEACDPPAAILSVRIVLACTARKKHLYILLFVATQTFFFESSHPPPPHYHS